VPARDLLNRVVAGACFEATKTEAWLQDPKHIAAITVTNTYPGGYWENQVSEARSRTHYIS
jgi:hypothetical protein